MARLSDLSFTLRTFLRAYRWKQLDPVPVARLAKPLDRCRVALVSSAGLVVPGDEPFDQSVKGGDWSYRLIPADADVALLEEHHRSDSFDHAGIEADRNLALPLDRLHELSDHGEIGDVAPRHASLMGSVTAPSRLRRKTAPAVADVLAADQVDVALLVPV
ncbi:MAG: selenoprotein B glycine/betaine/sarcosine/D-proline reductase [bacterium]|nr:selenoprotein B glycine/betaine/sarcosine/D-proline reductase [bacterium]